MTSTATDLAASVWPRLRYRDAGAALSFLTDVLGFRRTHYVPREDGTVAHAELRWPEGGGVMLGSEHLPYGVYREQDAGNAAMYVATDRVDEIHERAETAGAPIVEPLHDTDYGSHEFTLTDAEGNFWTFGTYRGAS